VGSGLILLVIVGAWLAVLVPMALRSHDSATSLRSADRFGDAMRVLSRRGARDVLVPRRSHSSLVISETKSPRPPTVREDEQLVQLEAEEPAAWASRTAAERRLRTLMVLFGLALVSLGLWLFGLRPALWAHAAIDLLLVAFVVQLRRQARLRARRAQRVRRAASPPAAARPVVPARPVRIAGIPDRMPARPAPLTQPLPAPAARYEDKPLPAAATGADGTWSPVPVPPPTYVGKAVAPKREPRVVDLTRPGQWTAALEADDAGLAILDEGPELDDILERRRAVNGW
jgi:hypothetical protein